MQLPDKISSRKKFLGWGAAVLASLTAFRLFGVSSKPARFGDGEKKETVKMLTQDGKLVEVDIDKLYCGKRKKISDDQLKKWVNKKQDKTSG